MPLQTSSCPAARAWSAAAWTGPTAWLATAVGGATWADGSRPAGSPSWVTRVPTIARHGLHLDTGGGEELSNLRGVLNHVQRNAADNHAEQRAVVSMGAGEWLSGHL